MLAAANIDNGLQHICRAYAETHFNFRSNQSLGKEAIGIVLCCTNQPFVSLTIFAVKLWAYLQFLASATIIEYIPFYGSAAAQDLATKRERYSLSSSAYGGALMSSKRLKNASHVRGKLLRSTRNLNDNGLSNAVTTKLKVLSKRIRKNAAILRTERPLSDGIETNSKFVSHFQNSKRTVSSESAEGRGDHRKEEEKDEGILVHDLLVLAFQQRRWAILKKSFL